jgi:hypothetical protein
MKAIETKREILLLTTSSFAQRELCENDFSENDTGREPTPVERLEEACWNGLLGDWIRGAPANMNNGEKLFLWKIHIAGAFLCIELSQTPSALNRVYSLDPYLFLPLRINN